MLPLVTAIQNFGVLRRMKLHALDFRSTADYRAAQQAYD